MKTTIRNSALWVGALLCLLTWGMLPVWAGDRYCGGLVSAVTLNQGETHTVSYNHLAGCTLKYVLVKPAVPTACSKVDVIYKRSLGPGDNGQTGNESSVCGSADADLEYKFPQTRKDYFPQGATFTCKQGTCVIRYGLGWYED